MIYCQMSLCVCVFVCVSNVVYFQDEEEELGQCSCTVSELIGVLDRRDSTSIRLALRYVCSLSLSLSLGCVLVLLAAVMDENFAFFGKGFLVVIVM